MKRFLLALLLFVCLAVPALADAVAELPAAQTAITSWLTMPDGHKYGPSWESASAQLKKTITRIDWEQSLSQSRGALGALKSRTLKMLTYTTTIPGLPDGDFVIIQYSSSFENKSETKETVTVIKEPDQVWRVLGYYIE